MARLSESEKVLNSWEKGEYKQYQRCNIFTSNGVIYSYGRHWPLAVRIVDKVTNNIFVLLNTQTYSSSTSRHLRLVTTHINHMHRMNKSGVIVYTVNKKIIDDAAETLRRGDYYYINDGEDDIPISKADRTRMWNELKKSIWAEAHMRFDALVDVQRIESKVAVKGLLRSL